MPYRVWEASLFAFSLKKFMSKDIVNKETGEVYDSRKLLGMIDDKSWRIFRN